MKNKPAFWETQKCLGFCRITIKRGPEYDVVYYRRDMPIPLLSKWRWYFEYRAALFKVVNPKLEVKLETGGYWVDMTKDDKLKRFKDKVAGKNRVISKIKNALKKAENEWNGLLPITEDGRYSNTVELLHQKEQELSCYIAENNPDNE